jgi:hypothetical protein
MNRENHESRDTCQPFYSRSRGNFEKLVGGLQQSVQKKRRAAADKLA